jgi:hypothetical protein
VLERPLRLRAPQPVGGNFDVSESVVFETGLFGVIAHSRSFALIARGQAKGKACSDRAWRLHPDTSLARTRKSNTRGTMDKEMLLQQLLDACHDGRQGAMKLARRTHAEPLRALLEESARQYRSAVDDIRTVWRNDTQGDPRPARGRVRAHAVDAGGVEDLAASWERAECEALTYFRDAYDGPLPAPIAEAVKRHYEAALSRLERLRKLRAGRRLP